MKKPTFFIVGNPKSGTTALYNFLKEHLSIFMPQRKELYYFAKDLCRLPDKHMSLYPLTKEEYLDLFCEAEAEQICGEASTGYLYSRVAAQNIHKFEPNAKIIMILREPIDFLQSLHLELLKNSPLLGETVKDFQQAIALESDRKQGKKLPPKSIIPEMLYYSEQIKYANLIKRFYKHFPQEQIKIIIYDDWQKNNKKVYQEILYFLEVDDKFEPTIKIFNQGGKKIRFRYLKEFILDLRHGRKYWKPVKQLLTLIFPKEKLRRKIFYLINENIVYSTAKPINDEFKKELKQNFKPEVIALSQLINRDLISLWNY